MKKDFKKIVDKALASLRRTYKPFDDNTGEFVLVDRDHAQDSILLIERASDNGKNNLPKTIQKSKDSIATDIDLYLNTCLLLGKTALLNRINKSNALSDGQSEKRPAASMKTEYQNASAELHSLVRSGLNSLFNKKRKLVDVDLEYKDFKVKNDLIGPAKYMDSKERFTHYGIIFLIFFVEILINIFTLGGEAGSHFDVGFETTLFAGVNFAFGYTLGNFSMRHKNSKKIFSKLSGYLSVLLILCLIVLLNLFFGHYRDVLAAISAIAEQTGVFEESRFIATGNKAKSKFLTNPFSMDEFKSYLLFSAGVVCALFSAKEFYNMDDNYPEYGKLQRDRDNFDKDYRDLSRSIENNCNDIAQVLRNNLIGGTQLEIAGQAAIQNRNLENKQYLDKYKFWIENIESTGTALYARYQEETLKCRTDNKIPQCFKHKYKLPRDVTDIDLPSLSVQSKELSQNKIAIELSDKIQKELNLYLKTIKSVQNLSADEFKMDTLDQKYSEIDKIKNNEKISNIEIETSNLNETTDNNLNLSQHNDRTEENLEQELRNNKTANRIDEF